MASNIASSGFPRHRLPVGKTSGKQTRRGKKPPHTMSVTALAPRDLKVRGVLLAAEVRNSREVRRSELRAVPAPSRVLPPPTGETDTQESSGSAAQPAGGGGNGTRGSGRVFKHRTNTRYHKITNSMCLRRDCKILGAERGARTMIHKTYSCGLGVCPHALA